MSTIEIIVFYVLCWWMVFYLALPFGNKKEENPMLGHAKSAPKNPRVKLKMIIASILTSIITLIFYFVASSQ
jgi:predicted secreted protein